MTGGEAARVNRGPQVATAAVRTAKARLRAAPPKDAERQAKEEQRIQKARNQAATNVVACDKASNRRKNGDNAGQAHPICPREGCTSGYGQRLMGLGGDQRTTADRTGLAHNLIGVVERHSTARATYGHGITGGNCRMLARYMQRSNAGVPRPRGPVESIYIRRGDFFGAGGRNGPPQRCERPSSASFATLQCQMFGIATWIACPAFGLDSGRRRQ